MGPKRRPLGTEAPADRARGPLQDRQAQLRGQSQELTKQLVTFAREGDRVRSRMGAILQGKLGFTNEELIRYGFRPRKPPVRRRVVVQQPPAGQQPPAETTPSPATQLPPGAPRS